jgi:hypothetical protein
MRAALILAFARVIPPLHRGLLHQVRTGDLGDGETADHAQGQGDASLHRQRRVTAGEDQP